MCGIVQPVDPTGKKKKKEKLGFILLMESETYFLFVCSDLIWKKAEAI